MRAARVVREILWYTAFVVIVAVVAAGTLTLLDRIFGRR